jgi:cellulose synthase/poly-beta-1,6-N-acetylglucosamine synthase-like glycosyltransferase
VLISFLISIGVLFYIFIGYPAVLVVLSLLFAKTIRKKDITPDVSLMISAYNEKDVIEEKLENTLALDYPREKLEIIVASEATDGTNAIVRRYADQGVILYAYENREGKPATLYRTVPRARGEIIVFSDANALYRKDALRKLVRNFADPRVGCVSGRLTYVNSKESAIGEGESAYWEFEFLLKGMLSRLMRLSGGVNGSIFAIRKALYSPIDKHRGDDYELSNRIQIAGHGVVLEPDAVSFEEASATSRQEFRRKVRLATWNLQSTLILMREALSGRALLTVFILVSHRFLRYTTPLWLITLFVSNLFLLEEMPPWVFLLQVLFYLTALAGYVLEKQKRPVKTVFLIPFYFCMVNVAALMALLKNLSRKTETLWEKAR